MEYASLLIQNQTNFSSCDQDKLKTSSKNHKYNQNIEFVTRFLGEKLKNQFISEKVLLIQ